jgi:hypothetical protein
MVSQVFENVYSLAFRSFDGVAVHDSACDVCWAVGSIGADRRDNDVPATVDV